MAMKVKAVERLVKFEKEAAGKYFGGFKIGAVKERVKLANNITPVIFSALFL
jgi:hypothetical protein